MKAPHFTPAGARSLHLRAFLLVVALACSAAFPSFGSDPVGVYAFVDKVVLEPSEAAPERMQLWGGFALAEGSGEKYAPAQRGYMYFKLPPGKEKAALREWNDLKSLAGAEQLVAFGARYGAKGTVRKADEKPQNPDLYVVEIGLTKATPREDYPPHSDLVALRKLHKAAAPAKR